MKIPSLAVAVLLAAGLAAAPVIAAENPSFDADWYVTQLQHKGIHAIDASEGWNGNFRATVELADGSTAYQYFDAETLKPVGAATPNTRVLSKLDTGAKLPASNESLLEDHFFD